MANQILIKFKPEGHKELIKAINLLSTSQKKLTNSVNKVEKASNKLAKKTGVLNVNNKRLAQTNGALANSFATIRSKMLLWSFAMSLGIRQISEMAKKAAILEGMERAFGTLSGGVDNATIAIDKLRGATDNTMSNFDLFQQANNAMILGVSKNSDEMAEMFDIAQRLGHALGSDTKSSVESLITGIGRQSRLMLDNIGIIVKAEEAYESYAQALNKTADDLTDAEKKQAFLTATMESARRKVANIGEETHDTRTSFQQLTTATDNLKARIGETASAFEPLVKSMTSFMDAIDEEKLDRLARTLETMFDIFKGLVGVAIVAFLAALVYWFGILAAAVTLAQLAFAALASTWKLWSIPLAGTLIYKIIGITDESKKLARTERELATEQAALNHEWEIGLESMEPYEMQLEHLEYLNHLYGESVHDATGAMWSYTIAQKMMNDFYGQTKQAQIEAIDGNLASIDIIASEIGLTSELVAIQDMLIERKLKLLGLNEKGNKGLKKQLKIKKTEIEMITERAVMSGRADENIAKSAIKAAGQQIKAYIATATAKVMLDKLVTIPPPWNLAAAAMAGTIVGALAQGVINAAVNLVPTFEQGGMVGGRRHSQGGTMIEAEQGEFVMSRNAVDAIGVENLNRMNQGGGGGVNITFSGNVMSQDFIEQEAIPQIKEALRRGADIGVS